MTQEKLHLEYIEMNKQVCELVREFAAKKYDNIIGLMVFIDHAVTGCAVANFSKEQFLTLMSQRWDMHSS